VKRLWPICLLAAVLLLGGCGGDGPGAAGDAARAAKVLTIASPHWEGVREEFTRGFREWYEAKHGLEVKVEWLDLGGTSSILKYIKSEFTRSPEGIGIDMMYGGGIDPFIELARLGYTETWVAPDELLEQIPETVSGMPCYDPGYQWYGAALSGFGIVYNKPVLEMSGLPEPREWGDLCEPKALSWVASADPRGSGSVHMIYEIMLQAYGWDKGWRVVTIMSANVRSFFSGSADVPNSVASGDTAYGIAIDSYALAQQAKVGADKIGYILPQGLTVINPDAICMLKGAPERELAEEFLYYVLSADGQKLWMLAKGDPEGPQNYDIRRMSIRKDLYSQYADRIVVPMNPHSFRSEMEQDAGLASKRWGVVNDLLGALCIDTHDDLVEAWKAVIKAGMPDAAVDELCRMPVTADEALEIAGFWDTDQAKRAKMVADWSTFAREKYRKAAAIAGRAE